jgi:hypothetical protein
MQAWVEASRLSSTFDTVEDDLESQVVNQLWARLIGSFDINTWTDENNTPNLIRSILAMQYVAWLYEKSFSTDDEDGSAYATLLRMTAENNIAALLAGTIELPDVPSSVDSTLGQPSFFPNDASSSVYPTPDAPADGPGSFSMGQVF